MPSTHQCVHTHTHINVYTRTYAPMCVYTHTHQCIYTHIHVFDSPSSKLSLVTMKILRGVVTIADLGGGCGDNVAGLAEAVAVVRVGPGG